MASITPINTATDTPSSAATKTNANELAINTELETNTTATALNTAKTGITTDQANEITANNSKVTNATHTGDVTGATALTIPSTTISGKTAVVSLAGTEEVLVNEAGTLKKTTTQDIADLGGGGGALEVAVFVDEKSSGTSPQTITTSYTKRDLNTTKGNTSTGGNISLSSSQITLKVGTYLINASCPAKSRGNRAKFYNTTSSATEIMGSSNATNSSSVGNSLIFGIVVVSTTSVFEILQASEFASVAGGETVTVDTGEPNVYTQITITKIA